MIFYCNLYIMKKTQQLVTANDSKSYLTFSSKLVHEYNNTYHNSIDKQPIDTDYSALYQETETHPKRPKFNVGDRVRITKHRNKQRVHKKISLKMLVIGTVLKNNPWIQKIKDLNGEKIIGRFHERELLLSRV